jgi:hypothetical protein
LVDVVMVLCFQSFLVYYGISWPLSDVTDAMVRLVVLVSAPILLCIAIVVIAVGLVEVGCLVTSFQYVLKRGV